MVFCNRCGNEGEKLYRNSFLEMSICAECRDGFDAWLLRKVIQGDETQRQANILLHESNNKLDRENFELKAKIRTLEDELNSNVKGVPGRTHIVGLGEAQKVLKANDYIYYKKPENWGQKNKKRIRRTKAEIEQDRQRQSGVEQ